MINIKDIVKFIESIEEDIDYDKTEVGKLSDILTKRFQAMRKDKDKLGRDMAHRKEVLDLQTEHALREEFRERITTLDVLKDSLWAEVYKELSLEDHGSYSMEYDTGIVSLKTKRA